MLKVVAFGWAREESYETNSNLHKYKLTPLKDIAIQCTYADAVQPFNRELSRERV